MTINNNISKGKANNITVSRDEWKNSPELWMEVGANETNKYLQPSRVAR